MKQVSHCSRREFTYNKGTPGPAHALLRAVPGAAATPTPMPRHKVSSRKNGYTKVFCWNGFPTVHVKNLLIIKANQGLLMIFFRAARSVAAVPTLMSHTTRGRQAESRNAAGSIPRGGAALSYRRRVAPGRRPVRFISLSLYISIYTYIHIYVSLSIYIYIYISIFRSIYLSK